jgi:hypothetical protein
MRETISSSEREAPRYRRTVVGFSAALLLVAAALGACSSGASVDLSEPTRLLGRSEQVRIDAQLTGDHFNPGQLVAIRWDVTNERDEPIFVAEVVPRAFHDPGTGVVTIEIGSALPPEGAAKIARIASGERKSFSAGVRMPRAVAVRRDEPCVDSQQSGPQPPRQIRAELHFLRELPQSGRFSLTSDGVLQEAETAPELFDFWVERNESLTTNAIPIYWGRLRSSREEERAARDNCRPLFP